MSDQTVTQRPIRKLPISLSNQIAAGEVVERPASILKELIENSIDAGAKLIRIEIQHAGLEKINVTDDGHGIPVGELRLAVSPHATSKIYSPMQLGRINTLGFRGEALASIASVSKFEIISRIVDDDTAWKLDYSTSKNSVYEEHDILNLEVTAIAHSVGTTVIANNIFYNTPARKKYLRSERTEYLHIERIIKQLILSEFNSAFTFIHNSKEIYRLQQASDQQAKSRRILKICGKSFYDNSLVINFEASGMSLTGWLGRGDYSRASADIQYFYINGRIIRDRVIFHAIRSAYKAVLPEGRYVAYVLYLTISTESIDVNVHPTKHEVRFNDMRLVHDFLSHVITQAITLNNVENNKSIINEQNRISEVDHLYGNYSRDSFNSYAEKTHKKINNNSRQQKTDNTFFGKLIKVLTTEYLLTENNSGIYFIDIKKAQSQLMNINLIQSFQDTNRVLKPLLFPQSISLDKKQIDILEHNIKLLNNCGLDYSISGLDSVLLRSVANELSNIDYPKLLKAITIILIDEQNISTQDLISKFCIPEIIISTSYNSEQAELLLSRLNNMDDIVLKNQIRNCWQVMSLDDIGNLFNNIKNK